MEIRFSQVPVLILAGGKGERLSGVTDLPKPLIEVAGRPFIGFLLEGLWRQGFRRITCLTGYGAQRFPEALDAQAAAAEMPFLRELQLQFLVEDEPLGTAGALRGALALVERTALVLNGDSYCGVDYREFLRSHMSPPADGARRAAVSLVAIWIEDARDYGCLSLGARGTERDRVSGFQEKGVSGPGWVNAGVYAMDRGFLDLAIPDGVASLEREILPAWSARETVWAYRSCAFFRDIGTPERLAMAAREFPPEDLPVPE